MFKVVVIVLMIGANAPRDQHGQVLERVVFEKNDFPDKATCEAITKAMVQHLEMQFSQVRIDVKIEVGKCEPAGEDA